jgi:hypothetical protein
MVCSLHSIFLHRKPRPPLPPIPSLPSPPLPPLSLSFTRALLTRCLSRRLFISPSIAIQSRPPFGRGIFATAAIPAGQRQNCTAPSLLPHPHPPHVSPPPNPPNSSLYSYRRDCPGGTCTCSVQQFNRRQVAPTPCSPQCVGSSAPQLHPHTFTAIQRTPLSGTILQLPSHARSINAVGFRFSGGSRSRMRAPASPPAACSAFDVYRNCRSVPTGCRCIGLRAGCRRSSAGG